MRVEQKWGFGMAPIKADVQRQRDKAVASVLAAAEGRVTSATADDASIVKGLFNRTWLQDQWDWFTVWRQLGYPGRYASRRASDALTQLRAAALGRDGDGAGAATELRRCGALKRLERYPHPSPVQPGDGYVYVLSTREQRELLKIGYTERDIVVRVNELNSVTGMAIPFGVRAVWVVRSARDVEQRIHRALSEYRVRDDREFFAIDFYEAAPIIRDVVHDVTEEL